MSQQVGQDKTLRMCDDGEEPVKFFWIENLPPATFHIPFHRGLLFTERPHASQSRPRPSSVHCPSPPLSLRSPIPRSFSSIHIAISLFELECANSTPSCLPLHGVPISNFLLFAASPPDIELYQFRLYVSTCLCLPINPASGQYFPIFARFSTNNRE